MIDTCGGNDLARVMINNPLANAECQLTYQPSTAVNAKTDQWDEFLAMIQD